MAKQDVLDRIHNFYEVALGYTEEQAQFEATRCLQCPNPRCVQGCPVGIDIPAFIKEKSLTLLMQLKLQIIQNKQT